MLMKLSRNDLYGGVTLISLLFLLIPQALDLLKEGFKNVDWYKTGLLTVFIVSGLFYLFGKYNEIKKKVASDLQELKDKDRAEFTDIRNTIKEKLFDTTNKFTTELVTRDINIAKQIEKLENSIKEQIEFEQENRVAGINQLSDKINKLSTVTVEAIKPIADKIIKLERWIEERERSA